MKLPKMILSCIISSRVGTLLIVALSKPESVYLSSIPRLSWPHLALAHPDGSLLLFPDGVLHTAVPRVVSRVQVDGCWETNSTEQDLTGRSKMDKYS